MKEIMNWYCMGDWHGIIPTLTLQQTITASFDETAVIILGDTGFNYYGEKSKKDRELKEQVNSLGLTFYCVRGNHEARPQSLSTIELVYDENVKNNVYVELEFPNIRYFTDYGTYNIGGYETFVIGGAYSVDRDYRLLKGWNWFSDEQLSFREQNECFKMVKDCKFDLILSHTCPYSWRPIDLFLPMIDQSTVDNTMELFLEEVKDNCEFAVWAYGHYHADRWENNQARLFYKDCININELMDKEQ